MNRLSLLGKGVVMAIMLLCLIGLVAAGFKIGESLSRRSSMNELSKAYGQQVAYLRGPNPVFDAVVYTFTVPGDSTEYVAVVGLWGATVTDNQAHPGLYKKPKAFSNKPTLIKE